MIRWGMIGCGDVTERKSGPAFYTASGSTLAGVWARRRPQAEDYARRHGPPVVFDSPEALAGSPDIDAVYIATPPASHLWLARIVAAAGKPCCVEKPMANTHAEAQAMIAAFREAGAPLFVAYYRRTLPRFLKVRALLAEGAIGAPRQVIWTLTRPPEPNDTDGSVNWRVDPLDAPGGYYDDLASHGVDLFDFLFGPIAGGSGLAVNQAGLYGAPDAVSAAWRHESGVLGSGVWNFVSDSHRERVEIIGERGAIRFSIFVNAPVELVRPDGVQSFDIPNPDPIQLPHVEAMIAHLTGGAPHPSLADSAARERLFADRVFARL